MIKGGSLLLASLGLASAVACSSNNSIVADGGAAASCSPAPTVEDTGLQECKGCTTSQACTPSAPLEGCCTWVSEPKSALARATTLHRYNAPAGDTAVDLSCLASPPAQGTPRMVTLTGYVWLFASGLDSQGVKVEVFKETNPNTDGAIDATALGSYTTSTSDAKYPLDTTWSSKCPSPDGCSFRRYTIANVPTETPLVIKTSDATGTGAWATLYDYNVYFSNSSLTAGDGGADVARYDATVAAAGDPGSVAGTVGQTISAGAGLLAGEVHDCGDVRLSGATVGVTVPPAQGNLFYFTSDEGNPLPDNSSSSTSILGLWGGVNFPTGKPIRVTAMGKDPASPGKYVMLGTYVVQVFPDAVTAISLRGRRPWQP